MRGLPAEFPILRITAYDVGQEILLTADLAQPIDGLKSARVDSANCE